MILTNLFVLGCLTLGLLSLALPIIPGSVIVFAGIAFHKLVLGEASVSLTFLIFALCLTLLIQLIDILGSVWGARFFGASWVGVLGALLGTLFGALLFSLPGLIIGPIAGALLFEWIHQSSFPLAFKAAMGALFGTIVTFFLKLGLTLFMIVTFLSRVTLF